MGTDYIFNFIFKMEDKKFGKPLIQQEFEGDKEKQVVYREHSYKYIIVAVYFLAQIGNAMP